MQIRCLAQRTIASPSAAVFELMIDPIRFPPVFTGYGLIPAIRSITLDAPLAVGGLRHIHNADGSVLVERVTVIDKPSRHAYTLGGFQPPFSWLVAQGEADWSITAAPSGTSVHWDYTFAVTSILAYPLALPLLKLFMVGAMRRCLNNMARLLESSAAARTEVTV